MKVTVKDKSVFLSIDPDVLQRYLETNEWEVMEPIIRDDEDIGIRYKKYNNESHRWCIVSVLNDPNLGDYALRMAENIYEIELATDKSQIQIVADIIGEIIIFVPENMSASFETDVAEFLQDQVNDDEIVEGTKGEPI